MRRPAFVGAVVGGLIVLAVVGGFLALDRAILHWYDDNSGPEYSVSGHPSIFVPTVATTAPAEQTTPLPTTQSDRQDCGQIRGTAYRSPAERDWYVANCLASAPTIVVQPTIGLQPPPEATPTLPSAIEAPTPTQGPTLLRGEATALAMDWLVARGYDPADYHQDPGTCTAEWMPGVWTVSCPWWMRVGCVDPNSPFCRPVRSGTFVMSVYESSLTVGWAT